MRIVCPSCEAEYEVPDTLLAGGTRKVRCARCAREWAPFAPPPPPVAVEPILAPPVVEHDPERPPPPSPAGGTLADIAPPLPAPRPPKRTVAKVPGTPPSVALVIAWLITAAVIGSAVFVVWLKRPEIVAAWPPAARLFKLFGLD